MKNKLAFFVLATVLVFGSMVSSASAVGPLSDLQDRLEGLYSNGKISEEVLNKIFNQLNLVRKSTSNTQSSNPVSHDATVRSPDENSFCKTYTKNLKIGSGAILINQNNEFLRNEMQQVSWLQDALTESGFLDESLKGRGWMNGATVNALGRWQQSKGITPPAGFFGPITRAAFKNECTRLQNISSTVAVDDKDISASIRSISNDSNPVVSGRAYNTDTVGFSVADDGGKAYGSGSINVVNNSWTHRISTSLSDGDYELHLFVDNKNYDKEDFTIDTDGESVVDTPTQSTVSTDLDIDVNYNGKLSDTSRLDRYDITSNKVLSGNTQWDLTFNCAYAPNVLAYKGGLADHCGKTIRHYSADGDIQPLAIQLDNQNGNANLPVTVTIEQYDVNGQNIVATEEVRLVTKKNNLGIDATYKGRITSSSPIHTYHITSNKVLGDQNTVWNLTFTCPGNAVVYKGGLANQCGKTIKHYSADGDIQTLAISPSNSTYSDSVVKVLIELYDSFGKNIVGSETIELEAPAAPQVTQ